MAERGIQDFNPQQGPGQPLAYIVAEPFQAFPLTARAGTPKVRDSQRQSSLLSCLSPLHDQV